ncbi:MAG TPA: hypothetical protein VEA92_01150 [Candidatus Paceibacterota bacterium]|nr:hypothetical protein [Candidatus Paceibacterota bacterium]
MKTTVLAISAALSIFATPVVAQELDIRASDRIMDPASGTPVSALLYFETQGRVRFLQAYARSQTYCDTAGHQNRANRYGGYDLDLSASVRGGGRNANARARFAGDVLEYYEDRERDRAREVARFRRGFCSDLRRLTRRLD